MSDENRQSVNRLGLAIALLTPIFLGMNPIFGKLALREGADPFTVAALRTVLAVLILWIFYYLFARKFLFIYPAGLMNCIAVGGVNGIGSLMYYNGLSYLDASIAQLINGMYLVFVVILTRIGGDPVGPRTIIRVLVAILGIFIITGGIQGEGSWFGVGLMLGNALLFAGTVVMSQRALYDMPAQTFVFYVLATMALVVTLARAASGLPLLGGESGINTRALLPIIALATSTALSRLLMFVSVKGLGSLQTTLLAVLEIAAALVLAFVLLGETLTNVQWIGVAVLGFSLLMPTERLTPRHTSPTSYVPFLIRTRIMQAAFQQAFLSDEADKFSTQQISMIQDLYKSDKYTTMDLVTTEILFNDQEPPPPK